MHVEVVNAVKYLAEESELVNEKLLCFNDHVDIWFTVTSVAIILQLPEQQISEGSEASKKICISFVLCIIFSVVLSSSQ